MSDLTQAVRKGIFKSDKAEDPVVTSYREMLFEIERVYQLSGFIHLKPIIENARAQLGRLPRDLAKREGSESDPA